MTKGILLIAVGNHIYQLMAINLLASIRVNDPGLPVALATDQPDSVFVQNRFDKIIPIPAGLLTVKGKVEPIKAKVHMYELSPWDKTIFLDVDMIMLQKRSLLPFFNQFEELSWTIANTGVADQSIWADLDEVKQVYGNDNKFWNYHSEFVYFKKCPQARKYFDQVKKIFQNPKVKSTSFAGGRMADELAFQIASMILNMYPHQENFTPTYWWARDRGTRIPYLYEIPNDKVSYSIGGHNLPNYARDNYNILANVYFNQLGLQRPYQAVAKKLILQERQKN